MRAIVRVTTPQYRITMTVAGFAANEIELV
jgi:hypothetical protein